MRSQCVQTVRRALLAKWPDSSSLGEVLLLRWRPHGRGRGTSQGSGRKRRDRRNKRKGTKWGIRRVDKRSSRTHGWLCGWRAPTPWAMQCDVQHWVRIHSMRKSDVRSVLSTKIIWRTLCETGSCTHGLCSWTIKNQSKNNPKSTCFVPEFADLEMSNIRRETLHGIPKGHQRPAGFQCQ